MTSRFADVIDGETGVVAHECIATDLIGCIPGRLPLGRDAPGYRPRARIDFDLQRASGSSSSPLGYEADRQKLVWREQPSMRIVSPPPIRVTVARTSDSRAASIPGGLRRGYRSEVLAVRRFAWATAVDQVLDLVCWLFDQVAQAEILPP